MVESNYKKQKITLMLLQESLWKVEDRVNIILESVADHEAELLRQKRLTHLILERLEALELHKMRTPKGGKNG